MHKLHCTEVSGRLLSGEYNKILEKCQQQCIFVLKNWIIKCLRIVCNHPCRCSEPCMSQHQRIPAGDNKSYYYSRSLRITNPTTGNSHHSTYCTKRRVEHLTLRDMGLVGVPWLPDLRRKVFPVHSVVFRGLGNDTMLLVAGILVFFMELYIHCKTLQRPRGARPPCSCWKLYSSGPVNLLPTLLGRTTISMMLMWWSEHDLVFYWMTVHNGVRYNSRPSLVHVCRVWNVPWLVMIHRASHKNCSVFDKIYSFRH